MLEKLAAMLVRRKLKGMGMEETSKKWYKSLGMWGGVLTMLRAAYGAGELAFGLPPVPPGVDAFLIAVFGGTSAYGRYTAKQPIG